MDSNFSDKLNKILNDPKGMEQIMALAKSLGESENVSQQQENPALPVQAQPQTQSDASAIAGMLKSLTNSPIGQAFLSGEKERIQLLTALKPYLSEAKQKKLGGVISAMESVGAISSLSKML